MHFQYTGNRIPHLIRFRHRQFVIHVDPAQDEHTAVLLDVTHHLRDEILRAEPYLARCQRAGKCARQSATRRRNHIVDGRGMRLDLRHVDAVVLGDRPVNTEEHGLTLRW